MDFRPSMSDEIRTTPPQRKIPVLPVWTPALQKIKCITTMMCCFACTLSCKNNHSVVVPTTVDDNDKIWLFIPFYLNQLL